MIETSPIVTAYQGGVGEMHKSSPEQVQRARHTIARYATDAADAQALLSMLGLDGERPAPKPVAPTTPIVRDTRCCKECGRAVGPRRGEGVACYGGRGMCEACYVRARRAANRAARPPRPASRVVVCACGAQVQQHGYRRCPACRETVSVEPVRVHLKALYAAGRSFRRIALDSKVSPTTVRSVLMGRPDGTAWHYIARDKAERILAVRVPS